MAPAPTSIKYVPSVSDSDGTYFYKPTTSLSFHVCDVAAFDFNHFRTNLTVYPVLLFMIDSVFIDVTAEK